MAKVFIGMPVFDLQDPRVIENQEEIFKTVHQTVKCRIIGANVEHARQILMKKFLESDCDHFFCVDADMILLGQSAKHTINRLISVDKDIVGGVYVFKRPPCLPVLRPLDLQKIYEDTKEFPKDYKFVVPKELFEVQWMGGGFKMVKRKVCEALQKKFKFPNLPMEYKGEYVSEDWAFDQRARELGFTVWADPTLKLGHLGKYLYTLENYHGQNTS